MQPSAIHSHTAGVELKRRLRSLLAQTAEPDADACAWLDGIALHQDGETLRVIFPHAYFAGWFAAHKRAAFESALRRHFADMMPKISYSAAGMIAPEPPAQTLAQTGTASPGTPAGPVLPDGPDESDQGIEGGVLSASLPSVEARTQAESGFAAFIANARNAFPLAAARTVAGLGDDADESSSPDLHRDWPDKDRSGGRGAAPHADRHAPRHAGQGVESCRVFVLCGKSGTGKTHLLRAMSAALAAQSGTHRVVSGSAARFCAEVGLWRADSETRGAEPARTESTRTDAVPAETAGQRPAGAGRGTPPGLSPAALLAPGSSHAESFQFWADRFWAGCDALVLDDLQELADDSRRQALVAACMDACPGEGAAPWRTAACNAAIPGCAHAAPARARGFRRMIFAHAGPAADLRHLDERLRSRLESGLVLELLEPDLDVRLRYLQRETQARGLELARDQLLYLAQRCTQFSLLQGLLHKVEAFAALNGRAPRQADLENIVSTGGSVRPSGCRDILGSVARGFNLRPEDLLGARRRPDHVLARQVAMYLCRRKLGLSYPELGRAFGGRDHSTVIHAVKKIRRLLETDKGMHTLVTELENTVP